MKRRRKPQARPSAPASAPASASALAPASASAFASAPSPAPALEDDDLATHFFSSAPPPAAFEVSIEPALEPEPHRMRLASPARRARFVRVVKLSVAACLLLCTTAVVRVVVARGRADLPTSASARSSLALAPVLAAAPPAAAPIAPPPEAPIEPPPPADTHWQNARAATASALAALEAHRVLAAIEAASAATRLDPADGDAWLVLGAAYQDAGRTSDAVTAYRTCKTQGRTDPHGECAAMLRALAKP